MTDSVETKEPKAKTVAEDMKARRVFDSVDQASAYLNELAESLSDFADTPIASPGIDSDGNFDPEIYTADMGVMVAKLMRQGKKAGESKGVKAIIVAPVPKLSALMESETGKAFVQAIIEKELNHRAARPLRDAEDISVMIDQMPTSIVSYIESSRGDAGILETFNELYQQINKALASKLPVWSKARLTKAELRKAMESTGYAQEYYPALEDYKGQSLFVAALNLGIKAAQRTGQDTAIFDRWLETRDSKAFDATTSDDEDFDLDSLDSLLDEPADTEEEAATAE